MKTYRIDSVEGKAVLANGYKIFNWDWTGADDYCYADENGNVEGSIHTVDGELVACAWGLHFCKNPIDCLNFYGPQQWNKFAEVAAYDELIEADNGKSVARTLKIEKVLTWKEFIEVCKTVPETLLKNGVVNSAGISYGSGISDGYGISDGSGISDGYGISDSMYLDHCRGVADSILCSGINGKQFYLFNKKSNEERINEVKSKIHELANGWYPNFTNAQELKEKCGSWESTPADRIKGRDAKEAYADMPKALEEYIRSLPEFNKKIFNKITGK